MQRDNSTLPYLTISETTPWILMKFDMGVIDLILVQKHILI